ncbi:hypothetical protein Hanom_Chr04g00376901 [Helianthus anomalus]
MSYIHMQHNQCIFNFSQHAISQGLTGGSFKQLNPCISTLHIKNSKHKHHKKVIGFSYISSAI